MIKSLYEAISYYKIKYNLLKNYDPLRAEEYKQLYEWLEDYKRLKEKEDQYNRWDMIKDTSRKLENNSIDKKDIEKIKDCIYKTR
ncbi:hypothetical protein R4J03_12660 [Brachyspira intermedia]|uniref:hypothetical protein n=1 Tax=Brachyspira intermedia TaxID=84377 RepID=UPI003007ED12